MPQCVYFFHFMQPRQFSRTSSFGYHLSAIPRRACFLARCICVRVSSHHEIMLLCLWCQVNKSNMIQRGLYSYRQRVHIVKWLLLQLAFDFKSFFELTFVVVSDLSAEFFSGTEWHQSAAEGSTFSEFIFSRVACMLYTISLLYHFMSWVSIGKNKDRLQIFFRTRRNIPVNATMENAAFNLTESRKSKRMVIPPNSNAFSD